MSSCLTYTHQGRWSKQTSLSEGASRCSGSGDWLIAGDSARARRENVLPIIAARHAHTHSDTTTREASVQVILEGRRSPAWRMQAPLSLRCHDCSPRPPDSRQPAQRGQPEPARSLGHRLNSLTHSSARLTADRYFAEVPSQLLRDHPPITSSAVTAEQPSLRTALCPGTNAIARLIQSLRLAELSFTRLQVALLALHARLAFIIADAIAHVPGALLGCYSTLLRCLLRIRAR